jgi:hypothetical protein
MQTFKEWMVEARKTLRETPRDGEQEVMDALLNDFATNPPKMKNGEAESESEVCGRLREFCELLSSHPDPGADSTLEEVRGHLEAAYGTITALRGELAAMERERDVALENCRVRSDYIEEARKVLKCKTPGVPLIGAAVAAMEEQLRLCARLDVAERELADVRAGELGGMRQVLDEVRGIVGAFEAEGTVEAVRRVELIREDLRGRVCAAEGEVAEHQKLRNRIQDALGDYAKCGEKLDVAIQRLRAELRCTHLRARSAEAITRMSRDATYRNAGERLIETRMPDYEEVRDAIGEVIGMVCVLQWEKEGTPYGEGAAIDRLRWVRGRLAAWRGRP